MSPIAIIPRNHTIGLSNSIINVSSFNKAILVKSANQPIITIRKGYKTMIMKSVNDIVI